MKTIIILALFVQALMPGSWALDLPKSGGFAKLMDLRNGPNCKFDLKSVAINTRELGPYLDEIEQKMRKDVVGHDEAIHIIVQMYGMYLSGMAPHDKPIGKMLLAGSTGIGKTELVYAFMRAVGLDPEIYLKKIDCAEYQMGHEISRINGPPPGYAGFKEVKPEFDPDELKKLRTDKHPYNIFLFDEIEKASQSLAQLLLGVLDKGKIKLGDMRSTDVRSSFVFGTTNLGVEESMAIKVAKEEEIKKRADSGELLTEDDKDVTGRANRALGLQLQKATMGAIEKHYSPEYLNRWDYILVLKSLRLKDFEKILKKELATVQGRAFGAAKKFVALLSEDAKEEILKRGTSHQYGARKLQREIRDNIESIFSTAINSGEIQDGDVVVVQFDPENKIFKPTIEARGLGQEQLMEVAKSEFPAFDFESFARRLSNQRQKSQDVDCTPQTGDFLS
jgi:ATP-dependent Clp protease ATP-binding subunit ClpA